MNNLKTLAADTAERAVQAKRTLNIFALSYTIVGITQVALGIFVLYVGRNMIALCCTGLAATMAADSFLEATKHRKNAKQVFQSLMGLRQFSLNMQRELEDESGESE